MLTDSVQDAGAAAVQTELDLPVAKALLPSGAELRVVDLFAGIGGLSSGFARSGFSVIGVDSEPVAATVYESACFGTAYTCDLASQMVEQKVPVIIGGPPCRPWSAVNLQRRRSAHEDHALLGRFVAHVEAIRPAVFVMENVPALGSDPTYLGGMDALRGIGFDVQSSILQYDRFGAATRRRRLFTVGVHGSRSGAHEFFRLLRMREQSARTVGDAIGWLRGCPRDSVPDHDWSQLESIGNYRSRYSSGQYGWATLRNDAPAPSFGSVAKTYILHPDAGVDGFPERVLSVREVLSIMGFDMTVRFPAGTSRTKRYQMAANSVSPQVSVAVASTVHELLTGQRP